MLFAAFWVTVGLALGAFVWVPITIAATKRDVDRQVERRTRFAMRYQEQR